MARTGAVFSRAMMLHLPVAMQLSQAAASIGSVIVEDDGAGAALCDAAGVFRSRQTRPSFKRAGTTESMDRQPDRCPPRRSRSGFALASSLKAIPNPWTDVEIGRAHV